MNLGMDQHPNVKAGVNNVESARQRVREGYAMYLPQISGNFIQGQISIHGGNPTIENNIIIGKIEEARKVHYEEEIRVRQSFSQNKSSLFGRAEE